MRRLAVGFSVLVLGVGLSVGTASAAQPGPPIARVVRGRHLSDGQVVSVRGFHWPKNSNIETWQCSSAITAGDQAACANPVLGHTEGQSGSKNKINEGYTVHTGTIGDGTCAAVDKSCLIEIVLLDSGGHPTSTTALASIAFGPGR